MNEANLAERVSELERRIGRMEMRLGMPPMMRAPAPVQRAEPVLDAELIDEKLSRLVQMREAQRENAPVIAPVTPREASTKKEVAIPAPAPKKVLPYEPPVAPAPVTSRQPREVEQFIGLKLAAWVGAIVLVIGMAFGLKFAYDQGWFGLMPPVLRVVMMYVGAFGLIGAGEVVYRRVNEKSAVGLYAAGVAALFLVSFAGHRFYNLYSPNAAFVLMAVSTLAGALVAARGNLVSIASLSLLGANVIPIILGATSDNIVPFLGYLLALQGVALALSGKGASGKWWLLRAQALLTTSLWVEAIALHGTHQVAALMVFGLLYAVLFQLELLLSAWRGRPGTIEAAADSSFCTLITAGAFALVYSLTESHFAHGFAALAFAAITGLAGATLHRVKNRARIAPLAIAYLAQSAALVILSVPLLFAGLTILAGWLVLACVFAVIANRKPSNIASASAVVSWGLAGGKLLLLCMTHDAGVDANWLTVMTTTIPAYVFLAGAVMVVGHAIAWLINDKQSTTLSACAASVFVIATIAGVGGFAGTSILVLYAWLLAGADAATKRLSPAAHAIGLLAVATLKWAVVDSLGARLSPTWSPAAYSPMFNPMILTGALVVGSIMGIYLLRRASILALFSATTDERQSNFRCTIATIIAILVTFAFTLEIDRAVERLALSGHALAWPVSQLKEMAWTMLWTAAGAALAAFLHRIRPAGEWMRHFAIFCLLMAAKFAIVDTLFGGSAQHLPTLLVNFQTLAGMLVAGALLAAWYLLKNDLPLRSRLLGTSVFIVLWTGTFELDRIASHLTAAGLTTWPHGQLCHLFWTAWWISGLAAMAIVLRFRAPAQVGATWPSYISAGIFLLTAKYIAFDTLLSRIFHGMQVVTPFANLQCARRARWCWRAGAAPSVSAISQR